MIFELLPFLRGWAEDTYLVENKSLDPGQKEIWRADHPGWVKWIELMTDQPYTKITDALKARPETFSFYTLANRGLQLVNPEGWLTVYDDTESRYMMVYGPRPFFRSVKEHDYFQVEAPTVDPSGGAITTPTMVYIFKVDRIEVLDPEIFIDSLRELLGLKGILSEFLRVRELLEDLSKLITPPVPVPVPKPPVERPYPPPEVPEEFDPALVKEFREWRRRRLLER